MGYKIEGGKKMFCKYCGSKLNEEDTFCAICGQQVKEVDNTIQSEVKRENIQEEKAEKKQQKKSKWKKRVIIFGVIIVLLISVGSYCYFTSSLYAIGKNLKVDNIPEVVDEYNNDVYGNKMMEKVTYVLISDYIQTLLKNYESGQTDDSKTYEILSALVDLKCEELSKVAEETVIVIKKHQKNEKIYNTAEVLYKEGKYVEAIEKYTLITDDSELYEKAKGKVEDSKEKYKENILLLVKEPNTLEEYENCLELLNEADKILTEDSDINKRREELNVGYLLVQKSTVVENVRNAFEAGKYSKVFEELEKALKKMPDDKEMISLQEDYKNRYIKKVINSVDSSIEEQEYNQAEKDVQEALKILQDNEVLTQKLAEIQDVKPVVLSTLNALNGGFGWSEETATDSFGNTYNNVSNYAVIKGFWYENSGNDTYAEYRIDGEYKKLSFLVGPHADIPEKGTGKIQIYADDVLVFSSSEIGRKTDVEHYEVDISNAKYIKIVVSACHYGASLDGWKNCILLMDCMLYK